jgi:hypothetical protein
MARKLTSWYWLIGGIAILTLTACVGPLAAQAESPPELAQVGQTVQYGGVGLTVNTVDRTDQIGSAQRLEQVSRPLQAGEGKIFIVVNLKLENKGQYRLLYQPEQFTLHDGRGTDYSPGVTAGAQPLGRGELEPSKEASGVVNFVVPQDAQDFVLSYRIPNRDYSISVQLGV